MVLKESMYFNAIETDRFNNFRSILRPLSQVGPYTFKYTRVFGK